MSHDSHYDRIPKLADFVSLMTALLLVDPLSSYLSEKSVDAPLAMMLTLLAAGLAAYGVEWAIETAASSWPGLRRVLVGSHFIEGTWIDVVIEAGKAKYVGIVHIEYDGHRFSFSGEDTIVRWNTEDEPCFYSDGSFHSEMAVLDWPNLRYKFSGRNSEAAGEGFHEGYSDVHFTIREKRPPTNYRATFYYLGGGKAFEAEGWKVSEDELTKLDNPHTRSCLLLRYVRNAEPFESLLQSNGQKRS